MGAHNIGAILHDAQSRTLDPGASGTITVNQSGHCNLTSAGAESRTLALPTKAGVKFSLNFISDGGDITLTVASAYDELGTTTATFSEVGQHFDFESFMTSAGVYFWRVVSSHVTGNLAAGLLATMAEINRAADVSTRIVNCTASTLTVTEAEHDGKIIVLDRAAGIAVTLPSASAGLDFTFIVKTTFTSAATVKSVVGTDIMIGHAIMGNDSDNAVVNWPAIAASTFDTINMLGTANSTGGMAGQRMRIIGLAAAIWYVEIIGDAGGTEATPFENTVT